MTTILLVLYLMKGQLTIEAMPMPDMKTCIDILPKAAKHVPDNSSLNCLQLRNESSVKNDDELIQLPSIWLDYPTP